LGLLQWLSKPTIASSSQKRSSIPRWICSAGASRSRISSTSSFIVGRTNSEIVEFGSASTRAICSSPVRAPCAIAMLNSRQNPRSALIREVRVAIHSERTRCSPWRACSSTDFTRTGTISAQRAASSSAQASAASVLLRLT
jgi:hypothetical protein